MIPIRVATAILDQFQSFYAFVCNACTYILLHVTDNMHQKLKHFFSSTDRLNTKIKSRFPKICWSVLSPKNFNSNSLKSYLTKRCWSVQITVCANGCIIFLENQIVFSKSFRVLNIPKYWFLETQNPKLTESELMQMFTIKILVLFLACRSRSRRHVC